MRGLVLVMSVALFFVVAACVTPSKVTAGNYASCAGEAAVASCSGSLEVKLRRTPVRSLFSQMKENRAARVSARAERLSATSCAGSTQTKLQVLCE